MRQKIFDGKSWYSPPPSLIHKHFLYRKFSETQHRRVPLRSFSVLWDKKFSMENRDITLWSMNSFFPYPKLVTHWRVPLRYFWALWDKKFLTENRDTPHLIHKFFRYQNFCETQKDSSTKFFGTVTRNFGIPEISDTLKRSPSKFSGTVRQKIFDRKSWYPPSYP